MAGKQATIVVRQAAAVFLRERNHTRFNVALVGIPIAVEEFAKIRLSEVAGMVQHDVDNEFHALGVDGIDESLQRYALRLVATVYLTHIHSMITVIVVARSIFDNRGNPNCRKAEGFNVVQLVDKPLKVAAPSRVANVFRLSVPAVGVVRRVAIVETCGYYKINRLVAEIIAVTDKR